MVTEYDPCAARSTENLGVESVPNISANLLILIPTCYACEVCHRMEGREGGSKEGMKCKRKVVIGVEYVTVCIMSLRVLGMYDACTLS